MFYIFREMFQFAIAGWRYFQSIENIIEVNIRNFAIDHKDHTTYFMSKKSC